MYVTSLDMKSIGKCYYVYIIVYYDDSFCLSVNVCVVRVHKRLKTDVRTHIHTQTRTCTYTYTHNHAQIHAHKHIHTQTYTHTETYTRTQTYTHADVHTHTDTPPHTHTHTYIQTYIHTYIHKYISWKVPEKLQIKSFLRQIYLYKYFVLFFCKEEMFHENFERNLFYVIPLLLSTIYSLQFINLNFFLFFGHIWLYFESLVTVVFRGVIYRNVRG